MGHQLVCGSASQVADKMIEWFESRACDGFSLNPPASIDAICNYLVPELQKRGYACTEYETGTMLGNIGQPRPPAWHRR